MKKRKKVIGIKDSVQNNAKRKTYLEFSWPFMALIFVFGVAMFATIEFDLTEIVSFHPIGVLAVVTAFIAGCSAVKNGFKVKQAWKIGALCFLAIFWIIPYSDYASLSELPITAEYFMVNFAANTAAKLFVNLGIYVLAALIGGEISSRVK